MRITQGTFSFLPDLTDEQIDGADPLLRSTTAGRCRWSTPTIPTRATPTGRCGGCRCSTSPTTTPSSSCARCVPAARRTRSHYIKLNAYDSSLGRQTTALSIIVGRPTEEPGFRLDRTEDRDRVIRYSLHPYAADEPAGHRYATRQRHACRRAASSSRRGCDRGERRAQLAEILARDGRRGRARRARPRSRRARRRSRRGSGRSRRCSSSTGCAARPA